MNITFCSSRPGASRLVAPPSSTPLIGRVALFAAIALSASLVGCGGGGGGTASPAAPQPQQPDPGPLASDSYLVAGVVGSEATGHRVVVADTDATRSAAVLSVSVLTSLPMMSTNAYTMAAASPSVTYLGSPLTFFVNGGKLWQIDLSPARVPVSVPLSSMTDACQPQMAASLDATGRDAWVLVTTAGADGDCSTAADNGQAFVRSGTPSTAAPTLVPASTRVAPVYLTGADGALWWMLAVDGAGATPRLVAYGPSLNVVEVAGGSGIRELDVQGHAAKAPEGTFVRADDMLRRIEASPAMLSIGAPQLAFTGASSRVLLEGAAMYFSDGDAVYRVEGDVPATLLARPTAGATSTTLLAKSSAFVVLTQPSGGGGHDVWAVDKRSGATHALMHQDEGKNEVWALQDDQLFYFAASRGGIGELRRIGLDASGDSRAVSNLLLVGRVLSRVWDRGERTPIGSTKALLACQPLPGRADCRGATLLQIDLPSLAVTALGSFPNSAAASWVARGGAAFEGVRGAVVEVHSSSTAAAPTVADLFVFNPGEANSLKQVSATTP